MYAQLLLFTIGTGMRDKAEKMAGEVKVAHKTLKGFKSDIFFGDDAIGEYGALTIWETPEDLKSAMDILHPNLEKALSGIAKDAPTVRVFEVYEPKG